MSGSSDKTLILWDVDTGEKIRDFEGHNSSVESVAFSPDGDTALSGSADGIIIFWDLETGREINRLMGHSNSVKDAIFCGNDHTVLSGSWDRTVRLWQPYPPDDLVAWTRTNRYVRELTCEELEIYGLGPCEE